MPRTAGRSVLSRFAAASNSGKARGGTTRPDATGARATRNRIDGMATANDRLVWIDCEMTGLDLEVDELVEVAVVVTDFDLVPVHPGFVATVDSYSNLLLTKES